MITDEQVKIAIEAYWSNETDELPAMRKALEAYEASKWVKFDEYDKSTYPPFDTRVLTLVVLDDMRNMNVDFMAHNKEWYNAIRLRYVTHWQPLPEFKE